MLGLIRNILADRTDDFTFRRFDPADCINIKDNTGLYIHIPFCKNTCPYCPYNKIKYQQEVVQEYKNALLKEINLYYLLFGQKEFSSIYIGGGTPTLMIDELDEILKTLKRYFPISGNIAIETSPNSINSEVLKKLKLLGFNLLSIGIQSFNNDQLTMIGRAYDKDIAIKSIELAMDAGFETVNADLIFAIENQSVKNIEDDLRIAVSHNVDQITYYPLFTFPYSEIGEFNKLKKLKLPNNKVRKKMYYFISDFLMANGYERTNVWSFSRKCDKKTFSSVTRDYYLGLGAGAGSYNGNSFYFNTFSIPEYIQSVNTKLPISIKMEVSPKLKKLFWLYWRLYETKISKKEYYYKFQCDLQKDFSIILRLIRLLGYVDYENEDIIKLDNKGSHWIHLLQNQYALNYVNKIWSVSKKNPWPEKIKL